MFKLLDRLAGTNLEYGYPRLCGSSARCFPKPCLRRLLYAWPRRSADAAILFSQPSDNFGVLFSQNDTGGTFGAYATVYDNFSLASSANIESVDFVGGYYNPASKGSITAFTISIYADSSNSPGGLLYSTNIAGNGGETLVGLDTTGSLAFSYAENIFFSATAGTQYWMSIVADLSFPPQWGWDNSSAGDGVGYQNFFGSLDSTETDSAFTLNDTPVPAPEPITLSLFGAGLAGAVAMRRRKKKAEA